MPQEQDQPHALISVSDKTGISDFARVLVEQGVKIISTGGTFKALAADGIPAIPIEEITGVPECLGDRIKTINHRIEGGIMYRRDNPRDVFEAQQLGMPDISFVICNLYPFESTVSDPDATLEQAISKIDIGGPTMLRAAAKNFAHVTVVHDPRDYDLVSQALRGGGVGLEFRLSLAEKAFTHTAYYDAVISQFFRQRSGNFFPDELTVPLRKSRQLRYGENPHQELAYMYFEPNTNSPLASLEQLAGAKDPSAINILDMNAGFEVVSLFDQPAAAVIKHLSPCGVALGGNLTQALENAIAADPESAFGGVIVLNRELDPVTATIVRDFKKVQGSNIDAIAAPRVDDEAVRILARTRQNMGVFRFGSMIDYAGAAVNYKFIQGGAIVQSADNEPSLDSDSWKVAGLFEPTKDQLRHMRFGWQVARRVRSNTVLVIDKDLYMTRGIGSGQTSRFRATELALEQAGNHARGGILVSDSFFPFDDSVKKAAHYGVGAIIQQGGSINDAASIEEANRAGIPMVFTGRRAFWH